MKRRINDRYFLIPGIIILAVLSFLLFGADSQRFSKNAGLLTLIYNIAFTALMWLGIREIVVFLWKKYPWEVSPVKHLISEFFLVSLYTAIMGIAVLMLFKYSGIIDSVGEDVKVSAIFTFIITYLITGLHEAWFFYSQWNISLLKAKSLEKDNIQSQFETLKSQINPHFLFNTLNTLSSIIEDNPKTAVVYVEKTADFLRTILLVKDKEVITLGEELLLIETFYFLQKERYGNNLNMTISVPESSRKHLLPPLSLQMLVENAIKHNIISNEKPLTITIDVSKEGYISVKNNLQNKKAEKNGAGIGLANIQNRYKYLSNKKIIFLHTADVFEVGLPLLINDNKKV